jgi:hypothetical protein
MARFAIIASAVLAAVAFVPLSVQAQVIGRRPVPITPGPTVSPYLNLLRPGSSTALNYYGLVRPQFQTLAGFQAVQQQFGQLSSSGQFVAGPLDSGLATGHNAGFMTYNAYFMTTNVTGGSAAPTTQPRSTANANRTPRR